MQGIDPSPAQTRPAPDRDKPLIRALKGARVDPPPFWFMRQAGRYLPEYRQVRAQTNSFLEFVYTPELATKVTLQPIDRFAMTGAILFADILVVPDGLGQKVWFETGHGPRLEPVRDEAGLARLSLEGFHDQVGPVYDTVARLAGRLPEPVTLIGFAGAPWTVATYMVQGQGSSDQAAAKDWAYGDPDGFQALIDLLVEATAAYLIRQIAAGAEAVQLFDSWAGGLPEAAFRRWCIEPARTIVERVRAAAPDVPIIGFPRGAGVLYLPYVAETGVDAVSLDSGVPAGWAADVLQPKVTVQGNLDPRLVVAGGQPMLDAAAAILDTFSGGPHVFNLGHGLVPETPPDNVAALADLVRTFSPAE